MLKVGIAGIGFMGWIHWLAYKKIEGVEVVAICENDPIRREGDWTGIQGNFGPPGEKVDLGNIEAFSDLESFCQSDFDLIDICLPPSLHSEAISIAAENGKQVFCEKPLSLTMKECTAAVEICTRHDAMLLVGQVLPFFPEYAFALQAIESGKFGKLLGCKLKRVISDPTWLKHFYDAGKVGGPLLDLHVHDAHFLRLIAGMPTGVYSQGRCRGDVVSYCESLFSFADSEICASATSGVIDQQGRPFTHGFEIHLEQATLQFEYASITGGDELMPLKVLREDGSVEMIPIENGDPAQAFVNELTAVVKAVQTGEPSRILSGNLARDAIAICHAQAKSVREKRIVAMTEV